MRGLVLGLSLTAAVALGCQSPITTASAPQTAASSVSETLVGRSCIIAATTAAAPHIDVRYEGAVTGLEPDMVVMLNPTRTTRSETATPIVGRLPYVGQRFRSVGVGTEVLPGEVAIPRDEITSVTLLPPELTVAGSDRRAPPAAVVPAGDSM